MSMFTNAGEEFYETCVYGIGYKISNALVKAVVDKFITEDECKINKEDSESVKAEKTGKAVLRDAVESSLTVLTSSFLMKIVRLEDNYVEKLTASAKFMRQMTLGISKTVTDNLKNMRGVRFLTRFKAFQNQQSDSATLALVGAQDTANALAARQLQYSSTQTLANGASLYDRGYNAQYQRQNATSQSAQVQLMGAMLKLQSGEFSEDDKTNLKHLFKSMN
jgi:hypothetical protein